MQPNKQEKEHEQVEPRQPFCTRNPQPLVTVAPPDQTAGIDLALQPPHHFTDTAATEAPKAPPQPNGSQTVEANSSEKFI